MSTKVEGQVAVGYEPVEREFGRVLEEGGEVGAAVAVYVEGDKVVDLWGGVARPASGEVWSANTPVVVFSVSKGALAVCAALLVERHLLDLDASVGTYWPEFARSGKQDITVRMLLSHRAGLPVLTARLSFDEVMAWAPVVHALEEQAPLWPPGTAYGYHAMTFGWLVGEVIRRVSGKSPGEFLQAEFGGECPDLWFGVPAADLSRLATLVPSGTALDAPGYSDDDVEDALRAANLSGALPFPSPCDVGAWNDQALLRGEVPAANMVATARDLARFYSLVVTGEPPAVAISRATITDMLAPQSVGRPVFGTSSAEERWGTGFMITSSAAPMLGPGSFGHHGAQGGLAFGDIDRRTSFAYLNNRMNFPPRNPNAIVEVLSDCISGRVRP